MEPYAAGIGIAILFIVFVAVAARDQVKGSK